ncbi:MAG: hypothetical protein ACOX21_01560 [Bacillota bacterium]|nr:hypothetical protein [Bacillota bacterium]HOC06052.1 hypothetical protein [Bacillota bacterium]HPZ21553.1 hypothetical protein [Bacillota bacterium]HQD19580.1 hypothetical protein [Bacillota bacterium]
MKVKENNLYFVAVLFFLAVVLGGLSIVDAGLNRLIAPEEPFISVAVQYDHGIKLKIPGKQLHLPCLDLCSVEMGDNCWHFARGEVRLGLPRFITLGSIERLRSLLDVDKSEP